jgi:lysylphosphatidylglycerol synthetase-like protein (DUF2156 family)
VINVIPGLLVVSISVLVAVAGLVLVQSLVSPTTRKRHNDVAGFIYAVVGVSYAVLLGLVIIAVWEGYAEARDTAHRESSELAEVFWLAHRLPEAEGVHIQEQARSYAEVVVEEEWPLMKEEGQASPRAWQLLDEIRLSLQDLEVQTAADAVLYQQGLQSVHDVNDARRDRLVDAEEGIPAILWVVLVVGGVIVVGFTYLFGMDSSLVHMLMVAAVAGVIALALFTVGTLDYPFGGGVQVGPEAFELILDRFESSSLSYL